MLKIEVGKSYKRKDGSTTTIVGKNTRKIHFPFYDKHCLQYNEDGEEYWIDSNNLVEEVVNGKV